MTDIEKFFTALSERAHRENDLSDLTYALCEADLVFKQFFLDFFFKKERIDASRAIIEREYSETCGRPDFHGRLGRVAFILPVAAGKADQPQKGAAVREAEAYSGEAFSPKNRRNLRVYRRSARAVNRKLSARRHQVFYGG